MKENQNKSNELDGVRLSLHFKLGEFLNLKKYPENIPSMQVVANLTYGCHQLLEPARQIVGPIIINSGFRNEAVNRRVGGVRNSQHLLGQAADIRPKDPAQFSVSSTSSRPTPSPTSSLPAPPGSTSPGILSPSLATTSASAITYKGLTLFLEERLGAFGFFSYLCHEIRNANDVKKIIWIVLVAMMGVMTMRGQEMYREDFVKGADVGFLQGQERRGVKFHDRNGQERECLELLKNDYQMSAIRMRVWVNPRGGDCDKFALLAMAKRVKALGMDLMVDFHYSDSWADPAKQPIPKAWLDHSFEEMKKDVRNHTVEVLSLLKENDIAPRWVQVGNETANGMLWPMGHIETEPQQYAGFIRAGYDAVKEVFPETIVIIHLDRGHNQSLYDFNLDIVLKYGGKFDMIGMSLYPYWAMDGHPELNADDIITDCMANIRHCSEKYGCDVMIVETGYEVDERHPEKMEEGCRQLARVIREARNETNGRCRGVFYWEPQCLPGGYKLGAFDSKAAPTAIMEGFIEKLK